MLQSNLIPRLRSLFVHVSFSTFQRPPKLPVLERTVVERTVVMSLVQELSRDKSWVHVKHPDKVETLLQGLISGGESTLQLVVDFDYTLTRAHKLGQKVDCSWGVMENSPLLPAEYTSSTNALKAKYLVIEQNPKMAIKDKVPYMIEWYVEANKLLQKCSVNRSMFPKMVAASNVEFRDHTQRLMGLLSDAEVPVLILSAGLGDLVLEICRARGVLKDNVKVVSNFLAFDEEGVVTGIDGPMIHVFNKNESAIHDSPYFKRLEHRHNIILMGDSLGDLQMADGIEKIETMLKIGFLNDHSEEKLQTYMNHYDIVLVDDQTMDMPNWLLEKILAKN